MSSFKSPFQQNYNENSNFVIRKSQSQQVKAIVSTEKYFSPKNFMMKENSNNFSNQSKNSSFSKTEKIKRTINSFKKKFLIFNILASSIILILFCFSSYYYLQNKFNLFSLEKVKKDQVKNNIQIQIKNLEKELIELKQFQQNSDQKISSIQEQTKNGIQNMSIHQDQLFKIISFNIAKKIDEFQGNWDIELLMDKKVEILESNLKKEFRNYSLQMQNQQTLQIKKGYENKRILINKAKTLHGTEIIKHPQLTSVSYEYDQQNFVDKFMTKYLLYNKSPYNGIDRIIEDNQNLQDLQCYQANSSQGFFTLSLNNSIKPAAFVIEMKFGKNNLSNLFLFIQGISQLFDHSNIQKFEVFGIKRNYEQEMIGQQSKPLYDQKFLGQFDIGMIGLEKNYVLDDVISFKDNTARYQFICLSQYCNEFYDQFRVEYINKGNKDFTCLYKIEILQEVDVF